MSANQRVTVQVDAIGNFNNLIGEVNKFRSQLQSLKLPDKLSNNLEKSFSNIEAKFSKFQSVLDKGITTKGDFSKLLSSAKETENEISRLKNIIGSIKDKDIQTAVLNSADIKKAEEELQKILALEKQLTNFGTAKGEKFISEAEVARMEKLANTSNGLKNKFQAVSESFKAGNIEQTSAALEKLIAHAQRYQAVAEKNGKSTQKWDDVLKWATGAKQQIQDVVNEANRAKNAFEQIKIDKFNQMKGSINGVATGINNATSSMHQYINTTTDAASRTNQLNEQVGHLRTQANYFFGLQNMGRLIARGIREAAESVRDLDKAMTETAVVTDFSVSDMWNMLPEYTALANKLGATTQGAYETMTLYFQQGLNKQQTFEIGEETMKMARIAGLDYAQTTNMMTAALRGFNMELNQTSAQRVNDVYSKLAAVTASDTRELGLAMERTASIAHSANMDFGNTTAFLAQMIETTREAPENLGTAMKTIIARFQELKKSPYEISEVEGEEVDFNRVDKALKSIGVDLMDSRDKFRDLDDVFMDISQRWDGLSQTTQRYIATMAAGSRQQSRFLAMVQNYDRLKELTDAAANSEGAATIQFNKTLDSYEAKVNKLKNAWQAFTMSLANNQAVKLGVDTLQKIITFGNKIIQVFGKVGGKFGDVGKAVGEMVAAFGLGALGFKGLQLGANTGLGMLAKMTTGSKAGGRFFVGGAGRAESGMVTAKITNPIVNAVNRVTAAIQKKPFKDTAYQDAKSRSDLVRERRDALYNRMRTIDKKSSGPRIGADGKQYYPSPYKAFNVNDVKKQLAGLTAAEQEAIYKGSPILQKALQRGYSNAYKKLDLGPDGEKALNKHWKDMSQKISSGQISTQEALRQLYSPDKVAQDIGGETGKKINEAISKEIKSWKPADKAALEKKLMTQAEKRFGVGDETRQERRQWVNQQVKFKAGQKLGISKEDTAQITKAEGAMTKFSGAANSAGQAVMGLGMALTSAGFSGAGTILMTVGNGIMGIGMAAEGASVAVASLGKAFSAIGVTGLVSALTNPLILATAALGGLIAAGTILVKKHNDNIKKIQKDSKKVLSDYEKGLTDTTRNINKLLDSKDTYEKLAQGVDENNNNISLGTAEYADYLQIVNEVAKMHPELVKGYNAHGQAILKNNNAVEEAIDAEKRRQHEIEESFSSEKSLNKLIAGRNTTKRWKVGQDGPKSTNGYIDTTKQSKLKTDAQAVIDTLEKLKGGDELLTNLASQFGVQVSDFTNLTDAGLRIIQEHGAAFLEQAQNQFKDTADKNTKNILSDLQNSIAQVGKDTEGIEAVTEPIYKSLSTYASQQHLFDNIPDEFRDAAERGLKEISKLSVDETGAQITGEAMQRMAKELSNSLADLGGHADEYEKLLDRVQKAQDDYVNNLDKEGYLNDSRVTESIAQLQQWADESRAIYEVSGKESDLLVAESFENKLASIKNFTEEGAVILSEGFNTFSDIIAAANGAFDDFSKQIESGDYYTGANAFKQIFDEIQDGIDNVGRGSQTWWKGAEKLLGEGNKNIKEGNFKAAEAQVKALEPMFQEGQAGVEAFLDHVQSKQAETVDSIKGKDGLAQTISDLIEVTDTDFQLHFKDLSGDQLSDLADKLGMSDQMLASMLNKAKQFYDIDFSNIDLLEKALRTADSSVFNEAQKGKKDIYTKESTFVAEAEAQGNTPAEIKSLKQQLLDKGIKLVKDAKDITSDDMKSYIDGMGIKTGQEFIDKFSQLGFSRDDLSDLYNKYSQENSELLGKNNESFNQMYTDYVNSLDDLTLETDDKQLSAQEQTNSILSQIYALLGGNKTGGTDELEKVRGKKGVYDTEYDHFALGQNKNGKALTDQEYTAVRQKLMQEKANNEAIIKALNDKIVDLSGKEKQQVQEQIDAYTEANKYLDTYLQKGEEKKRQLDEEKTKQDELNNSKEEGQNIDDSSSANDAVLQNAANLKKLNDAANDLNMNPVDFNKLFNLETGEVSQTALDLGNIVNTLKASGVEVEGLGAALQKLGPGGLEKLSAVDLGKLISTLNLTEEQAAAINALNPELHVTATADTSEADIAVQKVEEETAQPKTIDVVTNVVGGVKQVANKAAEQAKDSQQSTTTTNNITLQSNVLNPDEPKTKIDAAIPSTYKKTVKSSITIDSTTNTPKQKKETVEKKSGVINYKSNIQSVKVKDLSAKVKYTLGSQAKPKDKTAKVNYALGTQANPKAKTAKVNYAAKGMNNQIPSYSIPNLGSLAKGTRYGRLGPKGKGGLTLTGEEGYEIAWLPSESRSMILGANGPQMVNLPKDAVVYNHEQSEDILKKKKTIEAGSEYSGGGGGNRPGGSPSSSKKSKKKKKKSKKKNKKNKDKSKGTINNFSMEEVVRFNIDPKLTALTDAIEKRTKDIEKSLTKIGNTYDNIVKSAKDQITALKGVQDYNQKLYNSYNNQLAELRKQKGSVSWTDDKGKSHDKTINISSYLNADGSVNQAAIAKLSTRAEREATFNFISGLAKPLTDGMESAKKAIQDAQQQIEELGKKISEAFYQWENELTEVYHLTQRINNETSLTSRFTSQIELELAKLGAGFEKTAESIGNIRKVLVRNNDVIKKQIEDQQQMIAARQRELQAAYSTQDELDKLNKYKNDTTMDSATKAATVEWAQELFKGAELGKKYVKNIFKDIDGHIEYDIDWEGFNADNDQSPYNKETYEAIKKYLDNLKSAEEEFNKSIQDQTDFIKQTYDSLKEYQDKIVDIEDTLIDGVEEQIENETANAKKISDSIKDALKNLLDEVKRKLDERRQQEDNTKTEKDIIQKQQRLAALRADTAGGHQVEIAQLEKEIADAQQEYERTLEDQLLNRLESQADEAAQQRERQIELAETANDLNASTNKELVDMWLKDPERYKEEIKNAWLEANNYDEKGEAGQYALEQQFESAFAELVTAVEQSGFNNEQIFSASLDAEGKIKEDTGTLVNLLAQLNADLIGRQDELTHSINAQTDATDRNTESLLTVLNEEYSASQLKAKGVDAKTLKSMGYTARDLIGDDVNNPVYTAKELKEGGFTASELIAGGMTSPTQLKAGGYTAGEVKAGGITDFAKLLSAYTLAELIGAGFNQNDFGANNVSYTEARKLYSADDLKDVSAYSTQANAEIKAEADKAAAEKAAAEKAAAEAKKKADALAAYKQLLYNRGNKKKTSDKNWGNIGKDALSAQISRGAILGYSEMKVLQDLADTDALNWTEVLKAYIALRGKSTAGKNVKTYFSNNPTSARKTGWRNAFGKKWPNYLKGGLANYTGPAWLDGTPSKPELILNAKDTENFIALKDVLSKAVSSTSAASGSYGDTMYEININVDHLNSDYDVEKVAEKVKKEIIKGAGYRNVTQVRNFR